MAITIYGIKNCDTMKKAFAWLNDHGVKHDFHDYKASGIDKAHLERWCQALGWETVLNRAGTTFRAAGGRSRRPHREEGDRADDRATLDDQAADPGIWQRQGDGRVQA